MLFLIASVLGGGVAKMADGSPEGPHRSYPQVRGAARAHLKACPGGPLRCGMAAVVETRQGFDLPAPRCQVTEPRVLEAQCTCGKLTGPARSAPIAERGGTRQCAPGLSDCEKPPDRSEALGLGGVKWLHRTRQSVIDERWPTKRLICVPTYGRPFPLPLNC